MSINRTPTWALHNLEKRKEELCAHLKCALAWNQLEKGAEVAKFLGCSESVARRVIKNDYQGVSLDKLYCCAVHIGYNVSMHIQKELN